ncbi:MAG TPA: nitrilase-related carbon-nitrogen hydrolase, partial [Coleofasciculaceae cyanobacterium]
AEPFEGKSLQCVAQIAHDHQLHLLVGYAEKADNTVYNSAALIDAEGNRVANYRKIHLFGSEERRLFTPGKHWVIQTIAGFKVGILICFDVEFPEAVRALALQGAELIAAPTANGDARISKLVVPARALENQLFIAYANRAGMEGDLEYCGLSTIADPEGRVLVQADDQEGLWMVQLDRHAISQARSQYFYLHERRAELYGSTRLTL